MTKEQLTHARADVRAAEIDVIGTARALVDILSCNSSSSEVEWCLERLRPEITKLDQARERRDAAWDEYQNEPITMPLKEEAHAENSQTVGSDRS